MLLGNKPIGTIAYMGGLMSLPEPFCWSWGQMIQYNTEYLCNPGEYVHYERSTISFHAAARNDLVNRMKGDWLLMLDTDHQFDPDIVVRLTHRLYKDDLDVVCGIYQYKGPPNSPVIYRWNEKEELEPIGDWDIPEGDNFYYIPIGSSGAGCLMVRKRVFDRVRNELKEGPFDITPPLGEDHSFFKRLWKLGIKSYCDPSIEYNHLRLTPVSLKDYDKESLQLVKKENP